MSLSRILDRLADPVAPLPLSLVAVLGLLGLFIFQKRVREEALTAQARLVEASQLEEQINAAREHFRALADLKARDVTQFKNGMTNLAQSNKTLFETGLSLHEEKRLLEKQLEIMTTYLAINPTLGRIFLMRGDEPLASFPVHYLPLEAFGGVSETIRGVVRIISKERFAAPERGQSEMINGRLQYVPPQVGTSIRSNALGEFVVFTNSKLILHGPPLSDAAHEAFPHLCLGLSHAVARELYYHTFIGTKIVVNSSVGVSHAHPALIPPVSSSTVVVGPSSAPVKGESPSD